MNTNHGILEYPLSHSKQCWVCHTMLLSHVCTQTCVCTTDSCMSQLLLHAMSPTTNLVQRKTWHANFAVSPINGWSRVCWGASQLKQHALVLIDIYRLSLSFPLSVPSRFFGGSTETHSTKAFRTFMRSPRFLHLPSLPKSVDTEIYLHVCLPVFYGTSCLSKQRPELKVCRVGRNNGEKFVERRCRGGNRFVGHTENMADLCPISEPIWGPVRSSQWPIEGRAPSDIDVM